MKSEPLSLAHRPILANRLRGFGWNCSEYSFANLYLFRHVHLYEILLMDSMPLRGKNREGRSFLMPTSLSPVDIDAILTLTIRDGMPLFPIPEEALPLFQKRHAIRTDYLAADSDYLFFCSTLADYPGRNLSNKRNLASQFLSLYDVHAVFLTQSHCAEALAILEEWMQEGTENQEETDFSPCKEALELLDTLELSGRIVYADGKPVGFSIGEWLNPTCYAIHFCKGLKQWKGVYAYLFQDAARHFQRPSSWVNLEQDLGKEAIRKAKHSYHPDRLAKKLYVT